MEDELPFWKRKEIIIASVIGIVILLVVPTIILAITLQGDENEKDENTVDIDLNQFVWESMNGPPGGGFTTFVQNPYKTDEIYAGVPQGLFLSNDKGKNFNQVGHPNIRNVSSIHFSEDFNIVKADHLYSYDNDTGTSIMINENRYHVTISGSEAYFLDFSQLENELEIVVHKVTLISADEQLIFDGETRLFTTRIPMDLKDPLTMAEVHITNFYMVKDQILVSIGVIEPESQFVYDYHEIYLFDQTSGEFTKITPTLIDGFITATIEQYPDDDKHLLLGARSKKANDDFGSRTLDKLVMETMDAGSTWTPFTTDTNHSFSVVKDINIEAHGIYLGRVGDFILKVDNDDHENIHNISMPALPDSGKIVWVEWIEFDLVDPNIVYANLDLEFGATGFMRSIDNMVTWEFAGDGVPFSNPSNLAIHPTDGNIIATAGNIAHFPHITSDGGETWEMLTDLTTMGDELVFDPHDPDHMILVTEGSVFLESWDMGKTWEPLAPEFTGVRIFDLEVTDEGTGSIYASLHGTGISRVNDLEMLDANIQTEEIGADWLHLLNCPDYVYDIEMDPDDKEIIYATYSPKIFEDHSSVWKYDSSQEELLGWSEILKVPDSSGATSLAIDPEDTDTIYAAITGDPGQIYRTEDGGEKWEPLADELTFSTIHEMAVDPTDERVVLAAPWGGGIFKSEDSASSWKLLDTPTKSISSIILDGSSEHFFIGDRTSPSIFETDDGGETWQRVIEFDVDQYYRVSAMTLHEGELYVSLFNTEDRRISVYNEGPMSGTTFRMTETGPVELTGDMNRAVIGFASDGEKLFAVSHINGVYMLEGDIWSEITGSLPDIGFNGITSHDGSIYLTGGCDVGLYGQSRLEDPNIVNNIFLSSDMGENWIPLLDNDPFKGPIKRMVFTDTDEMVVGTSTGIYVALNDGEDWIECNDGLDYLPNGCLAMVGNTFYAGTLGGGVYHGDREEVQSIQWSPSSGPDPHVSNIQIKLDPTDSDTIYATSFPGGVFKSIDRGITWNECNFALPSFEVSDPITQGYYSLEIDPENSQNIFLGIYDHGIFISRDGANTWFPIYAVHDVDPVFRDLGVRRIKFDPSSTNIIYIVSDKGVFRSEDSGLTWIPFNDGLKTLDIMSIDITESGIVFAGTNGYGAYKFNRSSEQWVYLGRPIGTGEWAAWERRLYQYSALLFDPEIPGKIYLGQFPGGFFISEDNGETWRSSSSGLGNDGIFSLSIHPEDHDVILAGTYNGIWRSDNGGITWCNTSKGMPGEQWPFCVVIDDEDPNIMYTATKNGQNKGFMYRNDFGGVVMRSKDGGGSWHYIMNGLKNMSEYYQLIIHPEYHDLLFLSSSNGVHVSLDGGDSWRQFNNGMPTNEFYIRDNVASNLKMTPDMKYLIMAISGQGVWKLDISSIIDQEFKPSG